MSVESGMSITRRIDNVLEQLDDHKPEPSKTSPFFTIQRVVWPSGVVAKPSQYRIVHVKSNSPHYPEPGMRVMVTRKKPDAEKAIAELLKLDIDWSQNQYGSEGLYDKAEPILRKYHVRGA